MFPDYLPALGFDSVDDQEDLSSFCHGVIQRGTSMQVPGSERRLVRWSPGQALHVWMFVTPANEVTSLVPVYGRAPEVPIEIEQIHEGSDPAGDPMTLSGRFVESGDPDDPGRNGITGPSKPTEEPPDADVSVQKQGPVHVLCPDAPLYPGALSSTEENTFHLFASVRHPKLHPDPDAFKEDRNASFTGEQITSRTLLPAALLNLNPEPSVERPGPPPYAYVTGHVRTCERRENPETERAFYDLKVETRGTTLTVVVGTAPLPARPEPGHVIEGLFLFVVMMERHGSPTCDDGI